MPSAQLGIIRTAQVTSINIKVIGSKLRKHLDKEDQKDEDEDEEEEELLQQTLMVQNSIVWDYVLSYTAVWKLHSSLEHCTAVWNTTQQFGTLYSSLEHCTAVWNTAQQFGTLHSSLEHCTAFGTLHSLEHY